MQLIIIRGLQNSFPWTNLRKKYIEYFYPNMPGLILDKQPCKNPLELTNLPTTQKTLTVETGIQTEPEQEKVPDEEETTFPGTVPESANEVGSQKLSFWDFSICIRKISLNQSILYI